MKHVLLAACTAGAMSTAWGAPCPTGVPEGLRASAVGSDVVVNGIAMAISQVQGKEKVADILDRAEAKWKAGGFQVRRGSTAGWEVLSALGDRCLVTLQLAKRDGSHGYLARSRKATFVLSAASMGIPVPRDARIDSTVASDDDGRRGLVMSLSSPQRMEDVNRFFMEQLHERRWTGIRSHKFTDTARGKTMLFVSAQRDRQQVEIVIWPEQGSQIVMTVSDAP